MDPAPDRMWRRGLFGLGVLTPWAFLALILGVFVGAMGAKTFSGMSLVAVGFAAGVVILARKWRRHLQILEGPIRGETSNGALP